MPWLPRLLTAARGHEFHSIRTNRPFVKKDITCVLAQEVGGGCSWRSQWISQYTWYSVTNACQLP